MAITTSRSAMTPLVVQSLRPSRMYAEPSSVGTAELDIRAGSLPTSYSVSRKALISVVATSGRYLRFCSSVPKSISGWATPIDWWALSRVLIAPLTDPASCRARV